MICVFIILSLLKVAVDEINGHVNTNIKTSANGYCNFLDKTIEEQTLLMQSYSSMPVIIDYLKNYIWMEGTVFITLQKVLNNNKFITNAYILSSDSSLISSYDGKLKDSSIKISSQYPNLWNNFVSKNYEITIADNIYKSDINNGFVLPIICPILDYDNTFLGAFIGFIDWSLIIQDSLNRFGNVFTKDNSIFVINANNEFVFHNVASELNKKLDIGIPKNESSGIIKYDYFDESKLAFYKRMEIMPWVLANGVSEKLIYSAPKKMLLIGSIIGLIGIIISVLFSVFYIRKTINPIKYIVKEAKEISSGNFASNSNIKASNDEIGELLNSFSDMRYKFSTMIKEILMASKEIANSASELYAGSEDLAKRTEYQASSLEETASSMKRWLLL